MGHDGKHGGGAVTTCRLCKAVSDNVVRAALGLKPLPGVPSPFVTVAGRRVCSNSWVVWATRRA